MLPIQLFNNCSDSVKVAVKAFRVSGEGLGFVVTDVFAVSGLDSAWSIAGVSVFWDGCCGWRLCASGYLFECPEICGEIVVSHSGGFDMASYLLWAGQSLNQNLNSKCVVCMKLVMTLEHF